MLNHSLDNQSPSVVGPYRNSRSASICSLAPSETSVGASRPDRSRQSSISMPYPSRRPSDATDPEQMTWPPDATNLFQQLQDVQLSAPHSQGTQFTDNSQSSWPYQGAVAFPDGDLSMLTSNLYAPHVAVSAPDQFSSVMPMIRPSDASSMTFAANNQINVGEGADEAVSDKQREDQLAALAQAVRSAHTTSQSDKARSSFVQAWLGSNYVVWPEGNVSRQALYSSYSKVCEKFGVRGINSASFGKAVRAAFPQIKTRRLGVRGSKG